MKVPVCWHERPIVLVICTAIALLMLGIVEFTKGFIEWARQHADSDWTTIGNSVLGKIEVYLWHHVPMDPLTADDQHFPLIALVTICLVLSWRGRKKAIARFDVLPPNYGSPGRFWLVFLLVTWLVIAAVPQICITGFMLNVLAWFHLA